MVYRKNRRFSRHRPNGRTHSHSLRRNGNETLRMGSNSFSSQNRPRNNFRAPQNVEKLVEKYNILAKEALSAGDRSLSENYLQHADHFTRIMAERNLNQTQSKSPIEKTKNLSETNLEQNSTEQNSTEQNSTEQNVYRTAMHQKSIRIFKKKLNLVNKLFLTIRHFCNQNIGFNSMNFK